MPKFDSKGKYNVRITDANIRECPKPDAPEAFMLNLKGETPDGYEGWGSLYFANKVITGGMSAGMTCAQSSIETLRKIGVKDGYLGNLQEAILNGIEAQFSVDWEEYNGTKELRVKFINPINTTTPIASADFSSLLAKLDGVDSPEQESDIPDDFKAVEGQQTGDAPF